MKSQQTVSIIALLGTIVSISILVGNSSYAQQYQSGGNSPSSSTPSSSNTPSSTSPSTSNMTSSSNITNATGGGNMTSGTNMSNTSMTK